MGKRTLGATTRAIAVMLTLGSWLVVGPSLQHAEAALIDFEVVNHPLYFGWPTTPAGTAGFFVFDQTGSFVENSFSLKDVHMLVDTTTGFGTMNGAVVHNQSGDLWRLSASFTGIRSSGGLPQPVPYDTMFDDLFGHPERQLLWGMAPAGGNTTQFQLNLDTDLVSPIYAGPRNYWGLAMDVDGDGIAEPFHVTYRYLLDPNAFPGSEFDLLGGSGWVSSTGTFSTHGGDIHFLLRNPTHVNPPVPEPMTASLFGLGLVAGGLARRRRARRSTASA